MGRAKNSSAPKICPPPQIFKKENKKIEKGVKDKKKLFCHVF